MFFWITFVSYLATVSLRRYRMSVRLRLNSQPHSSEWSFHFVVSIFLNQDHIWPHVTIAGHRYMDGGVRSATNADLAHGYDRIVILNPLGANVNFLGASIDSEVTTLERDGSQVLLIAPDAASTTAIGLNPLDPETRQPSALAGRSQGRELVASVSALWSHP
jgi:hypothetical protein